MSDDDSSAQLALRGGYSREVIEGIAQREKYSINSLNRLPWTNVGISKKIV